MIHSLVVMDHLRHSRKESETFRFRGVMCISTTVERCTVVSAIAYHMRLKGQGGYHSIGRSFCHNSITSRNHKTANFVAFATLHHLLQSLLPNLFLDN